MRSGLQLALTLLSLKPCGNQLLKLEHAPTNSGFYGAERLLKLLRNLNLGQTGKEREFDSSPLFFGKLQYRGVDNVTLFDRVDLIR